MLSVDREFAASMPPWHFNTGATPSVNMHTDEHHTARHCIPRLTISGGMSVPLCNPLHSERKIEVRVYATMQMTLAQREALRERETAHLRVLEPQQQPSQQVWVLQSQARMGGGEKLAQQAHSLQAPRGRLPVQLRVQLGQHGQQQARAQLLELQKQGDESVCVCGSVCVCLV